MNKEHLDIAIHKLSENKVSWARSSIEEKIHVLESIKEDLNEVAAEWVEEASMRKKIPAGSPLVGEEWLSGPYAVMAACNQLIQTFSFLKDGKKYPLRIRQSLTGNCVAEIMPLNLWDRLLLSGVSAEVWMGTSVTRSNFLDYVAVNHKQESHLSKGALSLVLGAGNIAAISPLDCFQKLFSENSVVLLKMNPVNDYLEKYLRKALKSLILRGVLEIVKGDAETGSYLCKHRLVDEIHITGAESTHDAIVWGFGEEGQANKMSKTPLISKRITSELGAVCPTIVVPGPWSKKDIQFQAEQLATQKLHNSGFNCVALQSLIINSQWDLADSLLSEFTRAISDAPDRPPYYPGSEGRMQKFVGNTNDSRTVQRARGSECIITETKVDEKSDLHTHEVFAPALTVTRLDGSTPLDFLRSSIQFANTQLHGTLGANVIVHPETLKEIGEEKFEEEISKLKYGGIAINAWTGLNFLMPQCPWGAYPGHTLEDVRSGIGFVHNTFMLENVERCIVKAPFKPFPRSVFNGNPSLLPRPPWFITNKKADLLGKLLTDFQYKKSLFKIPRIFIAALRG